MSDTSSELSFYEPPYNLLPNEVLYLVFSTKDLSLTDLLNMCEVDKRHNEICKDRHFWVLRSETLYGPEGPKRFNQLEKRFLRDTHLTIFKRVMIALSNDIDKELAPFLTFEDFIKRAIENRRLDLIEFATNWYPEQDEDDDREGTLVYLIDGAELDIFIGKTGDLMILGYFMRQDYYDGRNMLRYTLFGAMDEDNTAIIDLLLGYMTEEQYEDPDIVMRQKMSFETFLKLEKLFELDTDYDIQFIAESQAGNTRILRYILDKYPDNINVNNTFLRKAAKAGNKENVLMIINNYDVQIDVSVLNNGILSQNAEIVELLLEQGVVRNYWSIDAAFETGNVEIIRLMLDSVDEISVDMSRLLTHNPDRVDILNILVDKGYIFNLDDITTAINYGSLDRLKYVLENKEESITNEDLEKILKDHSYDHYHLYAADQVFKMLEAGIKFTGNIDVVDDEEIKELINSYM